MKLPTTHIRTFTTRYPYPLGLSALIADKAPAMVSILQDPFPAYRTKEFSAVT
jgi:hypothetical protein